MVREGGDVERNRVEEGLRGSYLREMSKEILIDTSQVLPSTGRKRMDQHSKRRGDWARVKRIKGGGCIRRRKNSFIGARLKYERTCGRTTWP